MTPGARVQAAIEVLDEVIAAAEQEGPAADTILKRYFAARRYAGSKDRRAVRDLVYEAVRTLGERPPSGRAALLGARPDLASLFGTGGHAPAPLAKGEPRARPGLAPEWLLERLGDRAGPELLSRAPIDLRVNSLKTGADAVRHLGQPVAGLPNALTGAPADIARRPEYLSGLVEIQDAGSQRVVAACGARPGMTVIDLCAGGGGKTLGLAADMRNEGRLIASDTDRRRLAALRPRAERAGAHVSEMRLLDPGREAQVLADTAGTADLVLVDAPCSGTGTWRRNPEAKWRLTPERIARLTGLQARLLRVGAELVKPGGALVYAVCSLLPEEGDAVADGLAAEGLREESRQLLTPGTDGCDGFFIARFEKT